MAQFPVHIVNKIILRSVLTSFMELFYSRLLLLGVILLMLAHSR